MALIARILLWISSGIGLFGAVSLSYGTITGIDTCPPLGVTRACYVVAGAYILMVMSLLIRNRKGSMLIFGAGWIVAFGLAIYGSVTEVWTGDVCPAAAAGFPLYATPLCFISLGLCLVIGSTFAILRVSQANQKENE